jgi:hypothetical protein
MRLIGVTVRYAGSRPGGESSPTAEAALLDSGSGKQ